MSLFLSGTRAQQRDILPPTHPWFIGFSIVLAFLLNLFPWDNFWVRIIWADWLLLVFVLWGFHEPFRISLYLVWLLGLLVDINNGEWVGQHAMLYVLSNYLSSLFSQRFWIANRIGQFMMVGLLVLFIYILTSLVLVLSSPISVALGVFPSFITTILIFPVIEQASLILRRHRFKKTTAQT